MDSTDPEINYISGWTSSTDGIAYNQTTDPNRLVNVTLVGVQLSWYRYIGAAKPNAIVSSGEYSVDGKPFTSFQIPTIETDEIEVMYPLLFDTPSLEMGIHVLSVRYTGMKGQAPLSLHHLIVMNGSFPSESTSPMISGGDTNKTGTIPNDGPEKSPSKAGSIIGEALGPILGVTIVIAILFIYLKYHRKRKQGQPSSNIVPFYTEDRRFQQTRELPTNRTHSPPNIDINNIVLAEPSDSDSIVTDPFHTPILTSFQNNLPPAMNDLSNGTFSQQPLPAVFADPTSPTAATDLQYDRRRLSSPIVSWRVNDSPSPPSYTTEL